jgi:hypothetical protein
MIGLLFAAYARGSTIMNPEGIKQTSELAQSRERAAWRASAQRSAGNPVKHPHRYHRSRTIWHFADGHALAATLLSVEDGDLLPREWVPWIVDLAGLTDAGRMNGSSSSGGRSCLGIGAPTANWPSPDC